MMIDFTLIIVIIQSVIMIVLKFWCVYFNMFCKYFDENFLPNSMNYSEGIEKETHDR